MNRKLIRRLLKVYPSKWRVEYGPEMEDLLAAHTFGISGICNIIWSGLRERLHPPMNRFLFLSVLGSATALVVSVFFATRLWIVLAIPAVTVLREQGAKSPHLVSDTPWQAFEVIYVGIPLLMTAFVSAGWVLGLTSAIFTRNRLAICSSAAFLASPVLSLLAWQHGSAGMLLAWIPNHAYEPNASVGHYFELFLILTLGVTLLLQLPIVAVFCSRARNNASLSADE